jgi:3D (Asp-Asp-Asp) domain-containing protein
MTATLTRGASHHARAVCSAKMISASLRNTFLVLLLLLAALATWLTTGPGTEQRVEPAGTTPEHTQDHDEGEARAGSAPNTAPTLSVEMTAYTSEAAQTDATPALTASGAVAGPGTAAASRDLLERLPYGSQVEVLSVSGEGCGGWVPETPLTVADTMHPRIRNHLDVWLETTEQAINWGRCRAEVRVVESNGDEQ